MEKGDTYLAAKTRKRRARKGRESELQGPDSQLQSASSSPAWQGDKHSTGCNGQPCASGACILNLEGKKGEPRRGCWRLDKNQQFYENIYTKQVTENLDTAHTGTRYSCRTAARTNFLSPKKASYCCKGYELQQLQYAAAHWDIYNRTQNKM